MLQDTCDEMTREAAVVVVVCCVCVVCVIFCGVLCVLLPAAAEEALPARHTE